jgi:hypothetical protein
VKPLPPNTVIDWITLDAIQSEPLRLGAAYWNRLRGERPWPSRDELSIRDMSRFAHYMSLVQVIDDGADFLHRIVGHAMVCAFSVPIQNRRFSEIAVDAPKLIQNSFLIFRRVLETRAPVTLCQYAGHDIRQMVYMRGERVLLPLGRTSEHIDHILAFGYNETCAETSAASLL